MNEPHTTPDVEMSEQATDSPVLLEDVLLPFEKLHHHGINTTQTESLASYAAVLRAEMT